MDIKVLKNEGFTLSGSGVLRAFQNEKMPNLDLLVREAIQNSMDARRNDKNYVKAEINIDEFDVKKLGENFPQIYTPLYLKWKMGYNKFISISDKNTVGLTGPIRIADIEDTSWGRFLSLVQGIAKPQESKGAGGSWGYGKTVYYRVGIGLVIYYSRIKEGEAYKDRLMACLVENERSDNSILNYVKTYNTKTGVAWWGKKDYKFENNIIPLEDRDEIQEILECFDLRLYEGDETGTRIIIPFINEHKILNQTTAENIEDNNVPYWCKSLEDYIKVAIQKWYPTKIMNIDALTSEWNYNSQKIEINPWLELFINKKLFNKNEMLPLYNVIQELYNYSIRTDYEIIYDAKIEPIIIRRVFTNHKPAGKLVYVNLSKKDLKMLEPDNEESPYTQINNERMDDESYSNVIIAFCRKPGMILRYSIDDEWTNGIINPNKDSFLIALFVPNGYNEIEVIENDKKYRIELEEYLRASEEADHNNWTDIGEFNYKDTKKIDVSNLRIIWKIQKNIKSILKEELKIEEKEVMMSVGTILSRQLTKWFLPQRGFGKKATYKKISSTTETENARGKLQRKSQLFLNNMEISSNNELYKRFSLNIYEDDSDLEFCFKVVTENGDVDANEWESDVNSVFPAEILKLEIDSIIYNDGTIQDIYLENKSDVDSRMIIDQEISKISNTCFGFKIKILDNKIATIRGKLFYKYKDSTVEIKIEREKVKN